MRFPFCVRSQRIRYMRLHASPVNTSMPNSRKASQLEMVFMVLPPMVKGTETQVDTECQRAEQA